MNINSTKIFSSLEDNISTKERDLVIEDIMYLQDKMKPMGIVKDVNDLLVLKDKSLLMVLIWQHELFAITKFHMVSKEPPLVITTTNVKISESDSTLKKISQYFRNIFK